MTTVSKSYGTAAPIGQPENFDSDIEVPVAKGRVPMAEVKPTWFRADIEGLRAVAVILVVIYHAGVSFVSGGYVGVDVFFVISGFLITSLMVRELATTGKISILRFYARRVTRLLPAAAVTVLVTMVAAWRWMPPVRRPSLAVDALSTTFYGINYRLAQTGIDYLAADSPPSPLQHFWSLAVEEQFYLLWPPLLLLCAVLWRRGGRPPRVALSTCLAAALVGSFALGVWQTASAAPWAYFGAHTRAWELLAGGTLAFVSRHLSRIPRVLSYALVVGGLLAILAAAWTYSSTTPFPGTAVILPVAGSIAVIAGGGRVRIPVLGNSFMQGIGKLSYSWYLWHWPMLIIAPYAFGFELSVWQNLLVGGAGLAVALFSYSLVEDPVRQLRNLTRRPWRGVTLGGTVSIVTAIVALAAISAVPSAEAAPGAPTDLGPAGQASRVLVATISASAQNYSAPSDLTPPLANAYTDKPSYYADKCDSAFTDATVRKPCFYGDVASSTTVVLFGDSHAGHWFPALESIAEKRHWRLAVVTKSACSAADVLVYEDALKREFSECAQWRQHAWEYISQLRPSIVVLASNGSGGTILHTDINQDQAWTSAWHRSIEHVKSSGATVYLINDTPWPSVNVPDCVSTHQNDVQQCARSATSAVPLPKRRDMVDSDAIGEGVHVIDPTSWFCTNLTCPVIIGNVLVYKDASHMTTTYSRFLSPLLDLSFG